MKKWKQRITGCLTVCIACVVCSVTAMGADSFKTSDMVSEEQITATPEPTKIPQKKDGWYTYGSKKRYYKNGTYVTGMRKIHGVVYYFNTKGYMKTGWVKYNNKKYYFDTDGKRCSGVKKINGKYYYFNEKGVMKTGTVTSGKNTYYCTDKGILEAQKKGKTFYYANGKKMNETKAYEYETLQRAKNIVSQITNSKMTQGQKLQTCFNWVIKHYYATRRIFMNQTAWPALYANDYFIPGGGGNCFSDACSFAYLAKALGYQDVYVCVDTLKVNGSGHCWAEINGLVYDPLFAEAKNYAKYYGGTYRSYGLLPLRKVKL